MYAGWPVTKQASGEDVRSIQPSIQTSRERCDMPHVTVRVHTCWETLSFRLNWTLEEFYRADLWLSWQNRSAERSVSLRVEVSPGVRALSEQELDLMICKGPEGRWHIQFDMNENKAVRDRHGLFYCCIPCRSCLFQIFHFRIVIWFDLLFWKMFTIRH